MSNLRNIIYSNSYSSRIHSITKEDLTNLLDEATNLLNKIEEKEVFDYAGQIEVYNNQATQKLKSLIGYAGKNLLTKNKTKARNIKARLLDIINQSATSKPEYFTLYQEKSGHVAIGYENNKQYFSFRLQDASNHNNRGENAFKKYSPLICNDLKQEWTSNIPDKYNFAYTLATIKTILIVPKELKISKLIESLFELKKDNLAHSQTLYNGIKTLLKDYLKQVGVEEQQCNLNMIFSNDEVDEFDSVNHTNQEFAAEHFFLQLKDFTEIQGKNLASKGIVLEKTISEDNQTIYTPIRIPYSKASLPCTGSTNHQRQYQYFGIDSHQFNVAISTYSASDNPIHHQAQPYFKVYSRYHNCVGSVRYLLESGHIKLYADPSKLETLGRTNTKRFMHFIHKVNYKINSLNLICHKLENFQSNIYNQVVSRLTEYNINQQSIYYTNKIIQWQNDYNLARDQHTKYQLLAKMTKECYKIALQRHANKRDCFINCLLNELKSLSFSVDQALERNDNSLPHSQTPEQLQDNANQSMFFTPNSKSSDNILNELFTNQNNKLPEMLSISKSDNILQEPVLRKSNLSNLNSSFWQKDEIDSTAYIKKNNLISKLTNINSQLANNLTEKTLRTLNFKFSNYKDYPELVNIIGVLFKSLLAYNLETTSSSNNNLIEANLNPTLCKRLQDVLLNPSFWSDDLINTHRYQILSKFAAYTQKMHPSSNDKKDILKDSRIYNSLNLPKELQEVDPGLLYTLFIDRCFQYKSYDPANRTYSPTMFDDDKSDCKASYIESSLQAYAKLNFQNIEDLTLESLISANKTLLASKDGLNSLTIYPSYAFNPYSSLMHYYGYSPQEYDNNYEFKLKDNLKDNQYGTNNPNRHDLLNNQCTESPITKLFLLSSYENRTQIEEHFTRYKNNFIYYMNNAQNKEQKIAAIILFISQLECSHFFQNGNNRLCCQILLNKLLLHYKLTPSFLFIPNGFSHFVISSVNNFLDSAEAIDSTKQELSKKPLALSELTESLETAIKYVQEGTDFYNLICSADNQ